MDDQVFEPDAWVVDLTFNRVARVKDVYADGDHLDLVFYERSGDRLGRVSPPMGGPRGFEPACAAENWRLIEPPNFPLPRWGSLEQNVSLIGASHG